VFAKSNLGGEGEYLSDPERIKRAATKREDALKGPRIEELDICGGGQYQKGSGETFSRGRSSENP